MLAQLTQRVLRGVRPSLPAWQQPSARLHGSAQSPLQQPRIIQSRPAQNSSPWTSGFSYPSLVSTLRCSHSSCLALATPPTPQFTRRSFSSAAPSQYRYNPYNRFSGQQRGRGSLFYTLIHNAKPHHFVIIGLGISGVYFYNTDVVAVRKIPNPPTNIAIPETLCLTSSMLGIGNRPSSLHHCLPTAGTQFRRRGIPRGA